MNEIEKLAYDKVKEKIDNLTDCDRGAYFHGWFDCLYFVQGILEEKDKGKLQTK